MKPIVLLILPLLVFATACHRQQDNGTADRMTFYSVYGFRASNSVVMYQIDKGYLSKDDSAQLTPGYVFHTTQVMSSDKYAIARDLLDHVPTELLSDPGKTFGSPGSHDQTGYVIILEKDGGSKRFDIDEDNSPDQSKSVIAFKQKVADVLRQLQ